MSIAPDESDKENQGGQQQQQQHAGMGMEMHLLQQQQQQSFPLRYNSFPGAEFGGQGTFQTNPGCVTGPVGMIQPMMHQSQMMGRQPLQVLQSQNGAGQQAPIHPLYFAHLQPQAPPLPQKNAMPSNSQHYGTAQAQQHQQLAMCSAYYGQQFPQQQQQVPITYVMGMPQQAQPASNYFMPYGYAPAAMLSQEACYAQQQQGAGSSASAAGGGGKMVTAGHYNYYPYPSMATAPQPAASMMMVPVQQQRQSAEAEPQQLALPPQSAQWQQPFLTAVEQIQLGLEQLNQRVGLGLEQLNQRVGLGLEQLNQQVGKLELDQPVARLEPQDMGGPPSQTAATTSTAAAYPGCQEPLRKRQKSSTFAANAAALPPPNGGTILLKTIGRPRSFVEQDTANFKEFLDKTTMLADRSMFIHDLLTNPNSKTAAQGTFLRRNVLLCLPPGVGKTMAVTMAQLFLDHDRREENFKLFNSEFAHGRKFAIMKDAEFVGKHFGQYNVFSVDMKDVCGDKWTTARMLAQKLDQLFLGKWQQILNWLATNGQDGTLEQCRWVRRYNLLVSQSQSQNIHDYADFVDSLIELLFMATGGRRTVVLIDHYDHPIVGSGGFGDSDRWRNVGANVEAFVDAFRSASDAAHQRVALLLVAGVYKFPVSNFDRFHYYGMDTGRGKCPTCCPPAERRMKWVQPADLSKYFGFTEPEFVALCDSAGGFISPTLRRKAKDHLNGCVTGQQRAVTCQRAKTKAAAQRPTAFGDGE